MIKVKYNTSKYKFSEMVKDLFQVTDLQYLHLERKDLHPNDILVFDNESKTKYHNKFYQKMNSHWPALKNSYDLFIKNEITKYVKEDFIYQYMPSFRIHLPNDKAIHKWHYDSDSDHLHPEWEINFQVALTDMYNTQATWVESVPGLKNFKPMEMCYGEFYIFNGNKCTHGNKENTSGKTRISFDFRVLPKNKYNPTSKESVTAKKKFLLGEYYREVK
jgi:ectoine hydroxylase-related dioxygenase (phytanoyl-CoA dioxygenase family)